MTVYVGPNPNTSSEFYVRIAELNFVLTSDLTLTEVNGLTFDIFRTSGSNGWNQSMHSLFPFTAPCTIEFNKQAQAGGGDNGQSYAMIGWNEDPTTTSSYTDLDYASYPYRTDRYNVYHNGSRVQNSGLWSTSEKFYITYTTDGFIKHYNGSTLLYSVNYGIGKTVYVDGSIYSPYEIYGGFTNVKIAKDRSWDGFGYGG